MMRNTLIAVISVLSLLLSTVSFAQDSQAQEKR
jgi:hypothetical protein